MAETRYSIRVDQHTFHSEEGGAGGRRGGNGLARDRITSDEAYLTTTFGRHKHLPWGIDGGRRARRTTS